MTSFVKPTRPQGPPNYGNNNNPRLNAKMSNFDLLLKELSKVGSKPKPLQDVTNSARDTSSQAIPPTRLPKAPQTARNSAVAPLRPTIAEPAVQCMTPELVLERHRSALSSYEQSEISTYQHIYFFGPDARKMRPSSNAPNFGFDDDKGDYKVVLDDHVAYRYQVLNELGKGSFGQVSKALDHKTKEYVAMKIIKNKKKFHEQAVIEVNILKHLNERDHSGTVVQMLDHFVFRNHMVIIFQLHGMNLYELCKAGRFAPLPMTQIKAFAKQLLQTLLLTEKEKVVHCDLKPENILLKNGSRNQIQVIDFGSSCFEKQRLYTYIQSRFYRAPEIMLGIPYTTAIDMWSFGCILAELANGYPIFPGESETEQMQCIMEYLGIPPTSLLDRSPRRRNFFDSTGRPRLSPNSRGRVRRPSTKDLAGFLRSSNDGTFVDFLSRCLTWDPSQRMGPTEAVKHPWVDEENDALSARSARRDSFTLPKLSARR